MQPLEPFVDTTGSMTPDEVNKQNIENILSEINRFSGQQGANRQVNGTDFYYDKNGVNYMQIGLLPDGSYGVAIAKPGVDVSSAFS